MADDKFQSTRPVRGATQRPSRCRHRLTVSIHAPRAGRDMMRSPRLGIFARFNPRAPCGARLVTAMVMWSKTTFQSTRPVRGATSSGRPSITLRHWFQSTRPVRGATCSPPRHGIISTGFNPRAPCGARPAPTERAADTTRFNPRAPCGARLTTKHDFVNAIGFNPRAPCGARLMISAAVLHGCSFNPRAPCGARRMDTPVGIRV